MNTTIDKLKAARWDASHVAQTAYSKWQCAQLDLEYKGKMFLCGGHVFGDQVTASEIDELRVSVRDLKAAYERAEDAEAVALNAYLDALRRLP